MTESHKTDRTDRDLVDAYFFGELGEAEVADLETRLENSGELQQLFVEYSQFAANLQMSSRSAQVHSRVLAKIDESPADEPQAQVAANRQSVESEMATRNGVTNRKYLWLVYSAISISLLVGLVIGIYGFEGAGKRDSAPQSTVAWLVNAHDCIWVPDFEPTASLVTGDQLKLDSGVAHLRFACGADLTLQGPAELTLLSGTSLQLDQGKAAVKVPKGFRGFEIFSPQGRVLDLGTEFGVSVTEDGKTDVVVFEGEVETFVGDRKTDSVKLLVNQSASIQADSITRNVNYVDEFVRDVADLVRSAELTEPVPQTTDILFNGQATSGIKDAHGIPVGFNYRLDGTGGELPEMDQNLEIDSLAKSLKLTTTRSDINHQVNLPEGEYLGYRLSEFGFTGKEDFSVTALVPNIPNLEDFGQFGLYVGARSDQVIRGGLIKFGMTESGSNTIFLVNNHGGKDSDTNKVGLFNQGTDLRLVLSRRSGVYSLTIENISDGGATTLSIKHPAYLDGLQDLQVGIFGANPYSDTRKTVYITKFSITIWK